MRVLDSGYSGGLSAALWMERRRDQRPPVHVHEGDGLRLSRVLVLRYHHLSGSANCGVLRPHISGYREAGQSYERDRAPIRRRDAENS